MDFVPHANLVSRNDSSHISCCYKPLLEAAAQKPYRVTQMAGARLPIKEVPSIRQ
jgi:hypothetical protein